MYLCSGLVLLGENLAKALTGRDASGSDHALLDIAKKQDTMLGLFQKTHQQLKVNQQQIQAYIQNSTAVNAALLSFLQREQN